MSTPLRVAGFLVALAAVFLASIGLGRAVGPFEQVAAAHGDESAHEVASTPHDSGAVHQDGAGTDVASPGGLMTSQDGYALRLDSSSARTGERVPVAFTIQGPDGTRVTEYDKAHEKELHLVAVRRDQSGFQHVHPTLGQDGHWRTRLALTPGSWRVFADFDPEAGEPLILGADLVVPGAFRPVERPATARTAQVGGYTVGLQGDLVAGGHSELTLTVSEDGRPVTDLQPYLGAFGHLVALREGDLAYLHVHPHDATGSGPVIRFTAEVPSAGRYFVYLDFKHEGVVRTAAFTLPTEDGHDDH
jgi:hypothetical protein